MRRSLAFFIFLALIFTSVPVSSLSAEALVGVPGSVTVDGISLRLEDVSITDGSLFVDAYVNGTYGESKTLLPGESTSIGNLRFVYRGAYIGSKTFALIDLSYPYLFAGDELALGDYRFRVLSVDEKGNFKINATYMGKSEVVTRSNFKIGHLIVRVNSTPKVFDGVLDPGENITVGDHYVKLVKIWAVNSSGKVVSGAVFEVDGKSYSIESGKSKVIQPFFVNLKNAVIVGELGEGKCENCKGYAEVSVSLLVVSMEVKTVPDIQIKLSPGQTTPVGPYLLRYDYGMGNTAKVSLLNNCGQKLTDGHLKVGKLSYVLTYPGVIVGLNNVSSDGATFFAFLYPSEFPDVTKIANLLMSLKVEERSVRQYVPFDAVLDVKNTGNVTLKNVAITFEPSKAFKLISKESFSLDSIAPGGEAVFRFKLIPLQSGTFGLGRAYATVLAPFELACSHCTILTFTSNGINVTVEPSTIGYNISPTVPKSVRPGVPFNVSITVENVGDVSVPANLSLRVPSGVGVELSRDMALENGGVVVPLNLQPGDRKTFVFKLVPEAPGRYSFTALVETPYGDYSPVKFSVVAVQSNSAPTVVPRGSSTTVTTTVTRVTTVTKYKTKTVTTTVKVHYTPITSKLVWLGIGVVIGAGAIIGIAWYLSRSS